MIYILTVSLLLFFLLLFYLFKESEKVKIVGNWAIVAGCTEGIGKAFSELLASKGMNIVCISRKYEKTKLFAEKLSTDFNVQTMSLSVDFTKRPINEQKIIDALYQLKMILV